MRTYCRDCTWTDLFNNYICFVYYRVNVSIESKAESSNQLQMELTIGSNVYTFLLFRGSVYNNAHNALKVHLEKNQIEQHILDKCLMNGLQLVERSDRDLSQVAPTLQLLLQFGAQWKAGPLLAHKTTPYHLICKSRSDHHELLDSMLLSSSREIIGAEDSAGFTALSYAVKNANIKCFKSLIVNGACLHIPKTQCLFIEVINLLYSCSDVSQSIIADVFDLLCNRLLAREMLGVPGRLQNMYYNGWYNPHKNKTNIKSDVIDLLKRWNVYENNVIPLKMQCRRIILNHLSPQADKMIRKLPLPPGIVTYLSFPELNDIRDACRKSTRNQ